MKQRLNSQSGLTFWGLCFLLFFLGIVMLFTVSAFPLYNLKFQVTAAMNAVTSRPDASTLSYADASKFFLHNIEVTNIQMFNYRNIRNYLELVKSKKSGQPDKLHVHFKRSSKLFSDLYLQLQFDETKPMRGPITG
ncbi:MAG: hypothetical protein P8126_11725 [Gammaproteobacteria bacterium]